LNDPEASSISNEGLAVGEQLVHDYPASVEFRRDLANALVINEARAMRSNPTAAEAEHALSVYQRILSLRQGILADLLANRPEAFQPQRPTDSEAYMVFPSVLYAKCDIGWSFALGRRGVSPDARLARLGDRLLSIHSDLEGRGGA
jgi:hypothetical protein